MVVDTGDDGARSWLSLLHNRDSCINDSVRRLERGGNSAGRGGPYDFLGRRQGAYLLVRISAVVHRIGSDSPSRAAELEAAGLLREDNDAGARVCMMPNQHLPPPG